MKLCHIVGIGTAIPDDLTVSCLNTIRRSDVIISHISQHAINDIFELVPRKPVISLRTEYQDNRLRTSSYDAMFSKLLKHISDYEMPCYLTYGTPFFYDSLSVKLAQYLVSRELPYTVTAGVSSFDHIFSLLRRDVVPHIEVLDADWIVSGHVTLDATRALLIMQPSVFGTRYSRRDSAPTTDALEPLASSLKSAFDETHPVCFVHAATSDQDRSITHWCTVDTISSAPSYVLRSACLYVPPSSRDK
ncbi:precorrin-2 C20-methyltransferase [Phaeobacter sp. CECT 5382]|uniref:SAM-dependent methyltransferase n=1 Tax=Phaeobacter sp. CECT 5382 TaxID=1712645 RepID=UPI0006DB9981|nr:precorrin-2 C20-methyltransferase [Phaeobacter sp. CECT 5382]